MPRYPLVGAIALFTLGSNLAAACPYPGLSGLAASADIEIKSKSLQSALVGLYHEVSGLVTKQMIDDAERTITFDLDTPWSVGAGPDWQWTGSRTVKMSLSYMELGDAPVRTKQIPGFGSLEGKLNSRDTILLQVGG